MLQHHPLGSLSEFRNNSLIALQQRSPHGTSLGPHFFNHEDNLVDRRSRKISHLIHRATGLQLPGTPLPLYSHPCQDPESHPIRTGTSQRPAGLNELVRSTSFVLTIYTIPYPQGHSGLQNYGNPLASSPFLFDKEDPLPVYNLMHQSFSDNRLKSHVAEMSAVSTPTVPNIDQMDTTPTPPPSPRRLWALEQAVGDTLLKWQNVIPIQHGQDTGFIQAPPRAGMESTGASGSEKYKGHVLQILIEIHPTESIGNMVHKALMECYFPRSIVPAPDALHYTLGEYPSNLVWAQDRRPYHDLQLNALTGREISLSHDHKLEWITQEDSTILVFLPLPDTDRATSSQSTTDMLDTIQLPGHGDVLGNWQSNPLPKQQQPHYQTHPLSRQGESLQKSHGNDLLQEEIPPSSHQRFVRIPDTWTEKGR